MIGYILILLFLVLICWILISPIRITIDSQNQIYNVNWIGIGKIGILDFTDDLILRTQLLFWKKDFHPLTMSMRKKVPKPRPIKKSQKSSPISRRRVLRLFRSFQLKELRLNLDTDSVIYNSYLVPLFYFLNGKKRKLNINYQGELMILVMAENRLYRIIAAMLF